MSIFIYGLCALTALWCAGLLLRGYRRNKYKLLLWAGLCFLGLATNNMLLVVDELINPFMNIMLSWRLLSALTGMLLLLYGLIWDSE